MDQINPDPRRAAFDLTVAGVAAGLPVPERTDVGNGRFNHGALSLFVADNDRAAVDRWASWLGLPTPKLTMTPMETRQADDFPTGYFQPYESQTRNHPATGLSVKVESYVTAPAPAEPAEAIA